MSGPQVSVVMANYNGARHLAAAVRSVLAQTLKDLELIVVDDASTDDGLAVLAAAAGDDPRVIVLRQTVNGGPGAARNRALDAARGRWIAIVDSDDELAPDRLATLVARAEADDADMVVDDLMVFSDEAPEASRRFLPQPAYAQPRWISLADYVRAGIMYGGRPDLGFLKPLIATHALAGLRYAEDLLIGEDYDLVVRLMARGARLRLEPQPLYRYRKHAASISHRLTPARLAAMLDAQARFARAHPDLEQTVIQAMTERRRSLEAALIHERVVAGVKRGAVASSFILGLLHPPAWPLLTFPVRKRVRRIARAIWAPARTATP